MPVDSNVLHHSQVEKCPLCERAQASLRWIVEDSIYKAPEEHNWLSRRYAARAAFGLSSLPNDEDQHKGGSER